MSEKMNTMKDGKIRYDDIEKVFIVNQKKVNKKFEYKFRDIFTNPDAQDAFVNPKPDGTMYTFKIIFKDHSKMTAWAKSGTEDCDRLLDLASSTNNKSSLLDDFPTKNTSSMFDDFPTKNNSSTMKNSSTMNKSSIVNNSSIMGLDVPQLGKNELPQGVYIIGKDIPPGTYDFQLVWGDGFLSVYSAEETILGNEEFSEWMGKESYQKKACVHVKCEEGWYLHVKGNLIVKILKPQKVIIDL